MKSEYVFALIGVLYIIGLLMNRAQLKSIQKQWQEAEDYSKRICEYHEKLKDYQSALDNRNRLIYENYCLIAEALGIGNHKGGQAHQGGNQEN